MDKYSVLMTVYAEDNPKFFSLALDSMVRQSYPPDEIILVKDGPITENLQKIINDATVSGAPIAQVQLEKNVGLGLALNEGIKVAKNELIARMDSDDFSMPNRCKLQIEEFERNQALDIVGCSVLEFIGEIDNVVGERKVPQSNEEIYQFAKRRDPFNHPTVMYRKSFLEKVGCYSDYRKNQDTDLWIRMLSAGAICMNIDSPVFMFRFDERTYEKRKSWQSTKTLISIRYKAWKMGFNSLGEFLQIAIVQLGVYVLPIGFQRVLYQKVLRKSR